MAEAIRLDLTGHEAQVVLAELQRVVGNCRLSDEHCSRCKAAHAVITKLGA